MSLVSFTTIKMISRKILIIKVLALVCPLFSIAESNINDTEVAEKKAALEQRYQQSEWVSLVKIESVQSLISPTLSNQSGLTAIQGYSYSLSILEDWKMGSQEPFKLRVDLSDCPLLLAIDNDYLVFARTNYRGSLQVSSCKDMVHRNDVGSFLPLLESLKQNHLSSLAKSS